MNIGVGVRILRYIHNFFMNIGVTVLINVYNFFRKPSQKNKIFTHMFTITLMMKKV